MNDQVGAKSVAKRPRPLRQETRRIVRVIVAVLGMSTLLAGCSQETEPQATVSTAQPVQGTIVAVGDSLTAGLGVEEDSSYPAQLQRKLQAAGKNYRVVNGGVSGETSSGTLSRLNWILTMQPDIVILETGANDGLRGIDPQIPRENIQQILTMLRDREVVTVLTGMKMVWNLGPSYTEAFNRIYPEIAAKHGEVIFMPFFLDGVATDPALNLADGLHPNGQGYAVIVEQLYPYVLEAMNKLEKNRTLQ